MLDKPVNQALVAGPTHAQPKVTFWVAENFPPGSCLGQIWDKCLGTGLGANSRKISEPR